VVRILQNEVVARPFSMRLKSTWRRKRGFIWISASKTGHLNFEWLWPSITFVGKVLPVGFLVALAVAGQMSGFIEIPTGFPGPHYVIAI